jgi:Zn-finger in ubiquitin-hydrolases and other protein
MAGTEVDVSTQPSGPGCADCEQAGGWWLHLRRCAACGHVGCCDSSPSQHATAHWHSTGHPLVQSYEPDEDWFWNFETEQMSTGPRLAPLAQMVTTLLAHCGARYMSREDVDAAMRLG